MLSEKQDIHEVKPSNDWQKRKAELLEDYLKAKQVCVEKDALLWEHIKNKPQ